MNKYTSLSKTTLLERESYFTSNVLLNFTYGYPEDMNPEWIKKYQTKPSENFLTVSPATYLTNIERYFINLLSSKNITLVPTASFAFAIATNALVQSSKDEVIMFDPTYDSYPFILKSFKGKVTYGQRNKDGLISLECIKKVFTKNTKAIILCCPENPLGIIYSESLLQQIVSFCAERKITLVIDYCFAEISPFAKKVPIITTFPEVKNLSYILIGDTGKILGLKGSKFGALLYSDNWKSSIEATQSTYFFQYNQYDLYLLSSILSDKRFPEYIKEVNKRIATNYNYLKQNLHSKIAIENIEGSCFGLLDISRTGMNDIEFSEYIIKKSSVYLIPLSYFYTGEEKTTTKVRISLARSFEDIKKLTEILIQA